jgi:hypothetical protein
MRILNRLVAAFALLIIGVMGFVYLWPQKATRFVVDAERQRSR